MRAAPLTAAGWREGRLTLVQVMIIRANVPAVLLDAWARAEGRLLDLLVPLSGHETQVAMRWWSERARAEAGIDPVDRERDRSAHLSPTLDGAAALSANLTPDAAAVAFAALRKASERPASDDLRSATQRRHDALVAIFSFYLDHSARKDGSHHRPHLNVSVDLASLTTGEGFACHLDSGITITAAEAKVLACDAIVHRVLRVGSTILDYGRSARTFPAPLFTAIAERDGGCRFPDCLRPPAECDGHHIRPWEEGGRTDLGNGLLLCKAHHRLLHQPGWHHTVAPDGELHVTSPFGTALRSRPHPRLDGGPPSSLFAA